MADTSIEIQGIRVKAHDLGDGTYSIAMFADPPEGSGSLSALSDVNVISPSDGQALIYSAANGKWENKTPAGGLVTFIDGGTY